NGATDYVLKDRLVRLAPAVSRAIQEAKDRAERERLAAQFIEAQKMEVVGRLAGGVAHDFNNILAVIMGYSDIMMMKADSDSGMKSDLETIRSAAERAAGLTRQLLIFCRKETLQLAVLDLNDVVKDLDKMLRRLIDENIELVIAPSKESGRVKADSGYVGQLLMNLAVNARDAMPNGGKLTIATSNVTLDETYAQALDVPPGNYVMLSVRDTGTGMTDEVKANIFKAFFTTKPKGKGTGLGLATCQTIMQQSGGCIGVESELGKGTKFNAYFPRVDQPVDDAAKPQSGPAPGGTETLLVVEDEPSLRHLSRSFLEALGYEVLSASNGQDALHIVRDHTGSPIRLVITDIIMPQMGGKVLAEWLTTANPDLQILFTSGYTDDAVTQFAAPVAGFQFLPKPYSPSTLARKVREMLDSINSLNHSEKESPHAGTFAHG
ncbi:MAG TPA: ATP-binding protein, partial [Verrucomicrobiae bacterium]